MKTRFRLLVLALLVPWLAQGQTVNSGSDGSDGAFNPTKDTVINMADHPDGIYHYTSVNIPAGVTVSFIPNANNTPVVWLVQGDVTINGGIDCSGQSATLGIPGNGGVGGYGGGNTGTAATPGKGPGGGGVGNGSGGNASYGALGSISGWDHEGALGNIYGNKFLLPLLGGSGGGGTQNQEQYPGGGGGGAILVASSRTIRLNGVINASGGSALSYGGSTTGGGGSGGGVRLVAQTIGGTGSIRASGGAGYAVRFAGLGRVRFDTYENTFSGGFIDGVFTQGFQPIILPVAGQGIQLAIASVAGGSVPANPSSSLANPAVIVPAQQAGSVPVVVQCFNVPLNTPITVTAKAANGAAVSASGFNSSGTTAASTATVNLNLPRGSGILMAKATVATVGAGPASLPGKAGGASATQLRNLPLAQTGLTTDGERIAAFEAEATLGGPSRTVYVTESGKRIPAPTGK